MTEIPPTPPTDDNEGTDPGPEAGSRGERPRRLLRSGQDKMLGGVAGGLAEYFRIDPILIRIGFAITGLMGIGLLAYLALFIFVPEDDGWGNPVQARDRDRLIAGAAALVLLIAIPGGLFPLASLDWWWGLSAALFWLAVLVGAAYAIYRLTVGSRRDSGSAGHAADGGTTFGRVLVMVVAFSALAIFSCFLAFTSAWGAAVGGAGVVAVLVIICGVLLVVAAYSRPMRWLIVPALALALPAAAVQAADYELEGGYGDRVIRPTRLADIPDEGYKMAAGNMTIDLRQADWQPGSEVEMSARLNFGRIAVVVPKDVCVASDIDVWAGGFEILGESDSDFRVKYRRTLPEKATPKLIFDGEVDLGWVEVLTKMPEEDRHGPRRGLADPDASQPAHCLEAGGGPRDNVARSADERAGDDGPAANRRRTAR